MEMKHRIALIKISTKNPCSEPRRIAVEQYLRDHPEVPVSEARELVPFTRIFE